MTRGPLAADLFTAEGVLEWLLSVLLLVAGATGDLSWAHTATAVTVVAVIKSVRLGLLRLIALQKGLGGQPVAPALPPLDQVLAEIKAATPADPGAVPSA